MGGIGSGNHGGKPTVEDGLVLDLNRLIQQGTFRPGHAWGGSIVWTEVSSGRQVATIGYEAHMGQESGWACLHYTTTDHWSGEKTHHDYQVRADDHASALRRPALVVGLPEARGSRLQALQAERPRPLRLPQGAQHRLPLPASEPP